MSTSPARTADLGNVSIVMLISCPVKLIISAAVVVKSSFL
jgi:hypothetical protein